jgi:hypothetical protein
MEMIPTHKGRMITKAQDKELSLQAIYQGGGITPLNHMIATWALTMLET